MDTATLASYIGTSSTVIEDLFTMDADTMITSDVYQNLVASINIATLKSTLPAVRKIYDKKLPALRTHITMRYGINADVMSSHTLGNWVIGALEFPQYISSLTSTHENIAPQVFINEMPQLLDMVSTLPDGAAEWQKALCTFSLPLMLKS